MLLPALALALQVSGSVSVGSEGVGVSVGVKIGDPSQEVHRIPVTEEMRRTAFKDPAARNLLLRAREARLRQDSALLSYDARSYHRISVRMSLRETARGRLVFRQENASRVRWHRDAGAHIEVLGARAAVPFSGDAEREMREEMDDDVSIPYYPGKEQLWVGGGGLADAEVDEREIVHPIAEGSEAYYTFETGDSIIMTLPDQRRITLRELRIVAREPTWNAIVGSFWFDVSSAHLVRAVYRFSTPMDIWAVAEEEDPGSMDDVPFLVKGLITPMRANITSISVEFGLYNQRFWLPKLQGADGYAHVGFMHVPVQIEERFVYDGVNGIDSLPQIPRQVLASDVRDSLEASGLDSAAVREAMREFHAESDTLATTRKRSQCAAGDTYTVYRSRFEASLPVALQFPCDSTKLASSPELPGSIYDEDEDLFGEAQRDELVKALTMGLQPAWSPQRPRLEYGLAFTRFNRIEGFSSGARLSRTLGAGYTTALTGRASTADMQLNGELTLTRSNGRREVSGTLYRRLAVSSDFGDPLSFGSSLGSLLYARDEGFYHRAWGAELTGAKPLAGGLDWRLFAEQQWNAPVENHWSLFGGANDERFIGNVVADKAWLYGAGARWTGSHGLDPRGWRLSALVRAEAATGDFDYVRGLVETTVSRGLGPIAASLTGAAGTSGGTLPAQRHFFLGGLQTIRGQTAGSGYGESFWMGRLEIGSNSPAIRPVIFGDIGWAGPRDGWMETGRPLSGVGIGSSFLDGMIRVDLARGIHPRWQTRLDLYLEARF